MIGVFDSGVGGLTAYRELRMLMPGEDIIYFADTKNCPYGIKTEEELLYLVKKSIARLGARGAEHILIACCTASSLHSKLSPTEQKITTPIISPGCAAALRYGKRITVIATEYTVRSHAFREEIATHSPTATVYELAAQELVSHVERGMKDGNITSDGRGYLKELTKRIRATSPDVLILGCTHFSHLEKTFGLLLDGVKTVSPAREGAIALYQSRKVKSIEKQRLGRVIYSAEHIG